MNDSQLLDFQYNLLIKKHSELLQLRDSQTFVPTPKGMGYISDFAHVGQLDAKFVFPKRKYPSYYSVFQSKQDGSFHFGFIVEPITDEEDEEDNFEGVWRVADTLYTKQEFHNKYDIVVLSKPKNSYR